MSAASKRLLNIFGDASRRMDGLIKKTDNLAEAIARSISRSTDLVRQSDEASKVFSNQVGDVLKRANLKRTIGEEGMTYMDDMSTALRSDVATQSEHLDNLKNMKNSDPDSVSDAELFDAVKSLENSQKELNMFTELSNRINSLDELNEFKRIKSKVDDAKSKSVESVNKSDSFCSRNSTYCYIGAAVSGYYALNSWNNLKDEQKKCLKICYPEDYKTNPRNPTYKLNNGEYAALYPEMADQICTPENMLKTGTKNCDEFCKQTCDYDFDDVVKGALSGAGDDVKGLFSGFFEKFLGGNWKWWLLLIVCIPMVILILLVMLKN